MGRQFELAVSLEVAEHLPAESAEGFVASLVRRVPVVMFSAAIPGQGGVDHVNEQWPDYWARLFAKHEFVPVDYVRPRIWNSDDVAHWYAQNTLVYARRDRRPDDPLLGDAASRTDARLSVVHPKQFEVKCREADLPYYKPEPDRLSFSLILSVAPVVRWNAVRRRLGIRRPSKISLRPR